MNEAGCLIDPPVSVPIVAGVNFAANADADPPDENKDFFVVPKVVE